jgi:transglutaminase-like putative cysteine protease
MRYHLEHETTYSYATAVDLAHHALRLDVRALPWQRGNAVAISATPPAARESRTTDHFGNRVTHLVIEHPHERFTVTLAADVEVDPRATPKPETTPAWESVRDALRGDGFPEPVAESEFALDSPLASASPALADYAASSFAAGRPILAAVIDLTRRINAEFRYDPAATEVSTPLDEVLKQRAGVCQDFAHLEVAALRSLGLAARYVSGYIAPKPSSPPEPAAPAVAAAVPAPAPATRAAPGAAAARGLRGADASHAWVAVWCGKEAGWVEVDPTNNLIAGEAHVIAAWGRDYSDVSPVRGVILGGGAHTLAVAVHLTPR